MSVLAHSTSRRPLAAAPAKAAKIPGTSLLAIAARLIRELRVRRAIRDMQDLDDTILHDVGITRGGIEDAVRYGRDPWQGRRY